MKLVLNKDNRTVLHAAFAFWLFSEIIFQYTVISQVALLLFAGVSIFVVPKIRWPYVLTGYLLFVVWSFVNIYSGHAADSATAMAMTKTVLLCLIFLYGFSCYCRYIADVHEILGIYKWVMLIVCVPCLVGGVSNMLFGQRLNTFGINANTLAMPLSYALVILADEIINGRASVRHVGTWLSVLLFLMTILLTGSRKGLIIPFLGIYILVAFRRSGRFVVYALFVAIAAAVMLWLVLNVPVLYRIIGYRVEPVLLYLQDGEFREASMESRADYIRLGFEESKDSLLLGRGLDCFRLLRYAYGTYSHCNYVEILYSLGWAGVAFYYGPYVYTLFRIPQALREKRATAVLLMALFIPFIVCDYLNITYFRRPSLLIPMIVMLFMPGKEQQDEIA